MGKSKFFNPPPPPPKETNNEEETQKKRIESNENKMGILVAGIHC